jgi:tetratricopeptide (TPR) repeat protein
MVFYRYGRGLLWIRSWGIPVLALFFLAGCTQMNRALDRANQNINRQVGEVTPELRKKRLSVTYRKKAEQETGAGRYEKAFLYLDIARKLNPENQEVKKQYESLLRLTRKRSEEFFQKGVARFQKGDVAGAESAFITALKYNPDNEEALDFLNNRLTADLYDIYNVRPGDTLRDIAEHHYGDPDMVFLITYFNGLGVDEKVKPGFKLKLPVIEEGLRKKTPPVDDRVAEIKQRINEKDYEEALRLLSKLPTDARNREPMRRLADQAHLEAGRKYMAAGNLPRAMDHLQAVRPTYGDVVSMIAELKEQMRKQAEIHYKRGVKRFVAEDLKAAIGEWEQTLILDPYHQNARNDIQKARNLLEKLKKVD